MICEKIENRQIETKWINSDAWMERFAMESDPLTLARRKYLLPVLREAVAVNILQRCIRTVLQNIFIANKREKQFYCR